jgi:ATP-dependent Clp protease ATP-binding subunit ClpA
MFQRGIDHSQYKHAYVDYMRDQAITSQQNRELDPYSIAIKRLHISVIPEILPCRNKERKDIEDYISDGLRRGKKSPLYICGMPGTGKTATVLASINSLRKQVEAQTLPEFNFIEINCLRLKSPSDACGCSFLLYSCLSLN